MPAPTGYSRLQISLHWIVALLILWQFLFNDAMAKAWDALVDGLEPAVSAPVVTHILVGVAILLAVIWRLVITARRGAPAMIGDNAILNMAARLTHLGLYALLILMPVSGAVAWFGGVEAAAAAHNVMKVVLLALIALHVAGALYHQFVLRDGVMARMKRP